MPSVIHLIYVDPIEHHWRITGEERGQSYGEFADKEQAIDSARQLAKAKQGQLIVRTADHRIEFAEDFASVER